MLDGTAIGVVWDGERNHFVDKCGTPAHVTKETPPSLFWPYITVGRTLRIGNTGCRLPERAPVTADRPNVLLVVTDQQRGDAIGADPVSPTHDDGSPVVHTPNIDRLAADGALFSRAYSTCPACTPARRSLMRGQRPATHGCTGGGCSDNWDVPETLPRVLTRAGYQSYLAGKLDSYPPGNPCGFEDLDFHANAPVIEDDYSEWLDRESDGEFDKTSHGLGPNHWDARPTNLPERLHPTYWTTQRALEFLEDRDETRPFFLNVSYARPHQPLDPPQPYWDMYVDEDLPEPVVGDWAEEWYGDRLEDPPAPNASVADLSSRRHHRTRAAYYGLCTQIDHQLYRIVRRLQEMGEWENTFLIYTSDHGEMLGDHYRYKKQLAFEGSARVPFVVNGTAETDFEPGQVVDAPTCLEDVMPTLLDVADVENPGTVDGRSVLDPLQTGGDDWRSYVHGEFNVDTHYENVQFVVDDDGRKYVWDSVSGRDLLFDLEADPRERTDLSTVEDRREDVRHQRQRLVQELTGREEGFVSDGDLVPSGDRATEAL
jgi:arylsulfatase A-like enzyme